MAISTGSGVSMIPGGSSAPQGQTLRNIATRCRVNALPYSTNLTALMSRTYHVNKGNNIVASTGVKVVYGNWYAQSGSPGEVGGAVPFNLYVAIEYPFGTFTLGKFSGANFIAVPASTTVVSDAIPVAIPNGAAFWVHMLCLSTGGDGFMPVSQLKVSQSNNTPYGTYTTAPNIESNLWQWTSTQWASNVVDPTVLITTATAPVTGQNNNNSNFNIYPLAILSQSNVPSILCIGDSRVRGQNDAVYATAVTPTAAQPADYATWGTGQACRGIGMVYPYTNVGTDGDTVQQFNATNTLRLALQQYHTHVTLNYGINDITAGRSLATIQAALQSCWALFNIPVSHQTVLPKTTSTDSWATVANQTVDTANSVRTGLNDWLRGRPTPLSAVFDVTAILESAPNSGKWNAMDGVPASQNVTTLDGLHPSPYGYKLIQYADVFYPGAFN